MSVKRFLEPIPAPMFIKTEEDNKSKKPLRIVTACGPFTTSNNVAYLPLNDLLQVVIDQKPDVLMLVGPFVDASHPQFAQGNVEYDGMMVSFEDLFIFNGEYSLYLRHMDFFN
jgi:DNA polymerase alpha subunit B